MIKEICRTLSLEENAISWLNRSYQGLLAEKRLNILKSSEKQITKEINSPQINQTFLAMTKTATKTIDIKAPTDKVWDYVNDLSKWAEWAIHNVINVKKGENGIWLMEGPRGISKVKMHSDKATGVLDHDFIDPGEGHWKVPCRVVAGSDGSHLMITFTKPTQMPDEAFEMGMKMLDEELAKLKEMMEK